MKKKTNKSVSRTEHKQIEEVLSDTKEKLRLVLDSAGEGVYGLDINGNTTFINPAGAKMIGWEVNELIGKPQHAILHHTRPDGSPYPREECPIYAAFKDGKVHHVDDEIFWRKDGTSFPVEYTSTPIKEDGKLVGAVVVYRDITERRQVEIRLSETHNFLNAIIEGTPDLIFAKDINGRHVLVNSAFTKFVNKSEEDIVGKTNIELFPPEIARKLDIEDKEILNSGKTQYMENTMEIEGRTQTLLTTKYVYHDDDGKPKGILGISRDITARKLAEEEVRHLANHDELTGLPTLRLGKDRLSGAIALARRDKSSTALFFLDLDGFKEVNDSLGHKTGNQVLIEVGERLTRCVRDVDTVARVGGDEFIIVLTQIGKKEDAAMITEKIIEALTHPILFNGHNVNIGASIGIALYPDHGEIPDELIKRADEAMYVVKNKGKNNYAIA